MKYYSALFLVYHLVGNTRFISIDLKYLQYYCRPYCTTVEMQQASHIYTAELKQREISFRYHTQRISHKPQEAFTLASLPELL